MKKIIITKEKLFFDELRQYLPEDPGCGAMLYFEGAVRNHNHGKAVSRIDYEAYEPMCEAELDRIVDEAMAEFPIQHLLIAHRVGMLEVGETSLWVMALSPHRGEGFAGMQYAISQLKKRVPIWKREHYEDGSVDWVRCVHI